MRRLLVLLLLLAAAGGASAQLLSGVSKPSTGGGSPTQICGGFVGPGDIAGGAKIGAAIRAWTATLCGNRFANITVSGVSADMLTSATTGALVPQTINGSVCPNASTTLCVVTKWYDQTLGNNCTGSCDFVKTATEQLGVLTTTCPLPLTACIVSPTSAATFNQVAGNFTPTSPLTVSAFTNYTFGGSGNGVYVGGFGGSGGNATLGHASTAGTATYSCDGTTFPTATAADGSWFSDALVCGTSTMQLFLNGVGQGSQPLTPNLTSSQPYVGGIFASGPVIYETEVGIWNSDISGQLAALNANQRNFYGFVIAGDSFFDSVAGSDANNCATSGTPCQTVAKMKALSYTGGHAINWKGGSSFTGCLALSSGNVSGTSAVSPITIQQYSTGAAPLITGNCGTGVGFHSSVITLDSISATVNGIAIAGTGLGTGTEQDTCIIAQNSSGVGQPTVIMQNLNTTGCSQHVYTTSFSLAAGFPSACGSITVSLLNSTIHGASGITSADDTGLGGNRCGSPFVKPETTQGNIFFNIGGNTANSPSPALVGNGGTWNGSTAGSVAQFNLAHDNGSNSFGCGSSFALWSANTVGLTMQFSEAYNHGNFTAGNAGQCDQGGYDWDQSTVGDIGQYLYSHHNYGPGYLMFDGFDGSIFRYSISENDQWGTTNVNGSDGGGAVSMQPSLTAFGVYNMTLFVTGTGVSTTPASCASTSGGGGPGGSASGVFENNACWNAAIDTFGRTYMLNGINSDSTILSVTVDHNDYFAAPGSGTLTFASQWGSNASTYATLALFQAGTGQEANAIQTNPSTGTWTAAGTCTWTPSSVVSWPPTGCPSSYSTVSGAVKGTGVTISSPGTRDYYANAVPRAGPLWNIGAYGGP